MIGDEFHRLSFLGEHVSPRSVGALSTPTNRFPLQEPGLGQFHEELTEQGGASREASEALNPRQQIRKHGGSWEASPEPEP